MGTSAGHTSPAAQLTCHPARMTKEQGLSWLRCVWGSLSQSLAGAQWLWDPNPRRCERVPPRSSSDMHDYAKEREHCCFQFFPVTPAAFFKTERPKQRENRCPCRTLIR